MYIQVKEQINIPGFYIFRVHFVVTVPNLQIITQFRNKYLYLLIILLIDLKASLLLGGKGSSFK